MHFIIAGTCDPIRKVTIGEGKITASVWTDLDNTLVTGHSNGNLAKWDVSVS